MYKLCSYSKIVEIGLFEKTDTYNIQMKEESCIWEDHQEAEPAVEAVLVHQEEAEEADTGRQAHQGARIDRPAEVHIVRQGEQADHREDLADRHIDRDHMEDRGCHRHHRLEDRDIHHQEDIIEEAIRFLI